QRTIRLAWTWPLTAVGLARGCTPPKRKTQGTPRAPCVEGPAGRSRPLPGPNLVVSLPKVPVEHLFGEFDALELEQLEVLLRVLVERQLKLPRTREEFRILDGRLIVDVVGVRQVEALDDVRGIGRVIAGAVEPGVAVQTG